MGVPIIRAMAYWGLYWGPLIILGTYHIAHRELPWSSPSAEAPLAVNAAAGWVIKAGKRFKV